MESKTDRIEKSLLLRAPLQRVWDAVTDSRAFGHWFGAEFDGPFVAGEKVTGRIALTKVDAKIADMHKPYLGMACDLLIERIEPMQLFSFRWETYPVDNERGDEDPPVTLVTFRFEEVAGGTQLTIVESGFDRIPLARRAQAFADNQQGWEVQSGLLAKYLTQHAQVS